MKKIDNRNKWVFDPNEELPSDGQNVIIKLKDGELRDVTYRPKEKIPWVGEEGILVNSKLEVRFVFYKQEDIESWGKWSGGMS